MMAIIGRPNVGKSTFFNRVLGTRHAVVHDRPGITRDRNAVRAEWAGRATNTVLSCANGRSVTTKSS